MFTTGFFSLISFKGHFNGQSILLKFQIFLCMPDMPDIFRGRGGGGGVLQ